MKLLSFRRPLGVGAFVLCAVALPARFAHAHFLWAKVDVKSSPTLQLSFAEGSSDMTNGVPLDRLKTVVAWNEQGDKLKMAPTGAVLASALDADSHIAAAAQNYGVLDKTKAGRGVFLLEYNAKAAKDASQAGRNARLPLELFARPDGEEILVTLKHKGQPVPFGAVTLHLPDETEGKELTTDAQGQLRFKAEASGLYGLRAGVADAKAGTFEGKKYNLIRRYTTLSFPVGQSVKVVPVALAAAATEMGNANANPQAYALLKAAHDARQVVPENFAGYTAKVLFKDGDKKYTGTVTYDRSAAKDPIKLEMAGLDEEGRAWIEDMVGNQIGHRRGGDFAKGDGRNPLSLGDSVNSFGTLIKLNDRLKSEYRVRDNKVTEVTREMGDTRFTISVIETQNGDAGKYMSTHFTVVYRNKTTGAITQMDGFHDSYTQWNNVWLPEERMVMTFGDKETPRLRSINYRDFEALKK